MAYWMLVGKVGVKEEKLKEIFLNTYRENSENEVKIY